VSSLAFWWEWIGKGQERDRESMYSEEA